MKANIRAAATAALAAVLAACAPSVISPRYEPTAAPAQMPAAHVAVFLGEVSDRSGGIKQTGTSGLDHDFKTEKPLADVLRESIQTALGRLGATAAKTASEADAQLSATLDRTEVSLFAAVSEPTQASMSASLTVRDRDGALIQTERIDGRGRSPTGHPGCCPGSGPSDAIDAALDQLMTNFEGRFAVVASEVARRKADEADFQNALQAYRDAAVKPALPEDALRFKVQAEDAVSRKRFREAAGLYESGLKVAPWWPEGRYNRALVLGETGQYAVAIAEMKRYLLLVPDAPGARAAQNKIYAWEGRMPK